MDLLRDLDLLQQGSDPACLNGHPHDMGNRKLAEFIPPRGPLHTNTCLVKCTRKAVYSAVEAHTAVCAI